MHSLIQPPDSEISRKAALRVLDTQYSTWNNLEALEEAAAASEAESRSLHTESSESLNNVNNLLSQTRHSARAYRDQARHYALEFDSLTSDMSDLSERLLSTNVHGDSQPTLLEDLETFHRNLSELNTIKEYVLVVEKALHLSEASISQIRKLDSAATITASALSQYKLFQDYVEQVKEACSTIDSSNGRTLHLETFVINLLEKTWTSICNILFDALVNASESIRWPMTVNYAAASPQDRGRFEKAFFDLVNLQLNGRNIRNADQHSKEPPYPLQALIRPLSQRFKFHFEGQRETNKLDKPEWYFTHVLNIVHDHRPFVSSVIQHLFSTTKYETVDAWQEFTSLLIALPVRKLKHSIPAIISYPPLLAHTIYQAVSFDSALREEGYRPDLALAHNSSQQHSPKINGVSSIILGEKKWFEAWVEGERKFVDEQYEDIINAPDAWLIANDAEGDEEEHHSSDLKPTNSARRIKGLIEQVTDHYSPLPSFSQKTRFLVTVQLPVLEHYHGRIASSLTAFEALSNAFIRAVPGALSVALSGHNDTSVKVDTGRLTGGTDGLSRLCKAYLSTEYVRNAMIAWGEELFFIELWSEINHNASLRANGIQLQNSTKNPDAPNDTIFEELVTQYSSLARRSEDMMVQHVCIEIETALRIHFNSSMSSEGGSEEIQLSQTLLQPIALLSSHLKFIRSHLPEVASIGLYRRITGRLSEHILHRQIMFRGQVPLREGRQIAAECELWVEASYSAIGGSRGRAEVPWRALVQAARLIGNEDIPAALINSMSSDDHWEQAIVDATGMNEISREEVTKILKVRSDFGKR